MDASMLRLGQTLLGYEARMSVLSDNVANAGTAGFKAVSMTALRFDDALLEAAGNAAGGSGDQTLYFTLRTDIDFSQGDLAETGDASDLALDGSGFLCVQTGGGTAYVRSVSLRVDGEGYLTDANGNRLLGESGAIRVGDGGYAIGSGGSVVTGAGVAGKLRLSDAAAGGFVKLGNGYYAAAAGAQITQADCRVMQGYEEQSNVDLTREYVDMISISRSYQTVQRVITILDGINGKAVSQIGSL